MRFLRMRRFNENPVKGCPVQNGSGNRFTGGQNLLRERGALQHIAVRAGSSMSQITVSTARIIKSEQDKNVEELKT